MATRRWLLCPPLGGGRGRKKVFGASGPERSRITEILLCMQGLQSQPQDPPSPGSDSSGSPRLWAPRRPAAPPAGNPSQARGAPSRWPSSPIVTSSRSLTFHFHQQCSPDPSPREALFYQFQGLESMCPCQPWGGLGSPRTWPGSPGFLTWPPREARPSCQGGGLGAPGTASD